MSYNTLLYVRVQQARQKKNKQNQKYIFSSGVMGVHDYIKYIVRFAIRLWWGLNAVKITPVAVSEASKQAQCRRTHRAWSKNAYWWLSSGGANKIGEKKSGLKPISYCHCFMKKTDTLPTERLLKAMPVRKRVSGKKSGMDYSWDPMILRIT